MRLLFEVGEFGPYDTATTAYALLFFAVGLFAVSSVQLLTRAFYSLQDTVTPVKIGALTVLTNTALSLTLLRWTNLEHGGLALANAAASIVQMSAQLYFLRGKVGGRLEGRALLGTLARAGLAALIMMPRPRAPRRRWAPGWTWAPWRDAWPRRARASRRGWPSMQPRRGAAPHGGAPDGRVHVRPPPPSETASLAPPRPRGNGTAQRTGAGSSTDRPKRRTCSMSATTSANSSALKTASSRCVS